MTSESFNFEPFSSLSCICRSPVTHFSQSALDLCPSALALCNYKFMYYPVSLFTHTHNEHAPLASSLGKDRRAPSSVLAPLVLSNDAHQLSIKLSLVCLPIMVSMSMPLVHPQAVLSMFLIASVGLNIDKSHKEL